MEVSICWKINEFPKIPIKRNNSKAFCEAQTANHLKEVIQQIKPDKSLLLLWNKNFLREIYRNIQIIVFKVLRECISWASRNDAAPIFFSDTNQMIAERFVNWERFLSVLRKHIGFNVEWVQVRKMSEVFWMKLYWKISDFFFPVLLNLENLKVKIHSNDVHGNVWTNI